MTRRTRKKKALAGLLILTLLTSFLGGCGGDNSAENQEEAEKMKAALSAAEAVVISDTPDAPMHDLLMPEASGISVQENTMAVVDYSNAADGYVMVRFTAETERKLKVRIAGPTTVDSSYQYNLKQGEWEVFPLSDGNGTYTVKVYEHTGEGNKYATVLSADINVTLTDEFAPFLRPNQYVNYAEAQKTVAAASALAEGISDPLEKVKRVYEFVITWMTYDTEKAETVQSGYLPVLDRVLEEKKGICFDYAALMTAMLRSQGVPCKLVVGYVGAQEPAFHAWISVWVDGQGWIKDAIYFDGTSWQRMDPTFAASAGSNKNIMQFIGDGTNYLATNLY